MTATVVAVVKIICAIAGIYGICRLETYLESKLTEPYGTRTDLLFITTVFSVVGLSIFICCQSYLLLKPFIIGLFHI